VTAVADAGADHGQAAHEENARRRLQSAGAASLPRTSWWRGSQPSAVDLIQFALWRAPSGDVDDDELLAALALLPAARVEVDQVEAALLFTARAHGLEDEMGKLFPRL
jgi:hypothetical protein